MSQSIMIFRVAGLLSVCGTLLFASGCGICKPPCSRAGCCETCPESICPSIPSKMLPPFKQVGYVSAFHGHKPTAWRQWPSDWDLRRRQRQLELGDHFGIEPPERDILERLPTPEAPTPSETPAEDSAGNRAGDEMDASGRDPDADFDLDAPDLDAPGLDAPADFDLDSPPTMDAPKPGLNEPTLLDPEFDDDLDGGRTASPLDSFDPTI